MTGVEGDLVQRGVSEFNTIVLGTTDLLPEDFQERIEFFNSQDNLVEFFYGPGVYSAYGIEGKGVNKLAPGQIGWKEIQQKHNQSKDEAYLVSIVRPTAGYSEVALMSAASRASQLVGGDRKNDLIYDYPLEVQREYWRNSLGVMQRFCHLRDTDQLPGSGRFNNLKPVLMGHHGRELSKYPPHEDRPGIRTVVFHHDHLVFIDEETIKSVDWDDSEFRLDREAKLFSREKSPNLSEFVTGINSDLKLSGNGDAFEVRKSRPIGYQKTIDFSKESTVELADFFNAHFQSYSIQASNVERGLRERGIKEYFFSGSIVQPTFTFFIVPQDEASAQMIISPTIVATGGPERAGMLIKRRPDVSATYTPEEKHEFWSILTDSEA